MEKRIRRVATWMKLIPLVTPRNGTTPNSHMISPKMNKITARIPQIHASIFMCPPYVFFDASAPSIYLTSALQD